MYSMKQICICSQTVLVVLHIVRATLKLFCCSAELLDVVIAYCVASKWCYEIWLSMVLTERDVHMLRQHRDVPAATLGPILVSPRPSPDSGTGRIWRQETASLDSAAQESRWLRLNTKPKATTVTWWEKTSEHNNFPSHIFNNTHSIAKKTNLVPSNS